MVVRVVECEVLTVLVDESLLSRWKRECVKLKSFFFEVCLSLT